MKVTGSYSKYDFEENFLTKKFDNCEFDDKQMILFKDQENCLTNSSGKLFSTNLAYP
jgi:hypothetical protein